LQNRRTMISEWFGKLDESPTLDALFKEIDKAASSTEIDIGFGVDQKVESFLGFHSVLKSLFESSSYKRLIALWQDEQNESPGIVLEIVQVLTKLAIAVDGDGIIKKLNVGLFSGKANTLIDQLDLKNIFRMSTEHITTETITKLLASRKVVVGKSEQVSVEALKNNLFRELLEMIFDYSDLVSEYWSYLYKPKADWNKFSKMATLLYSIREYIVSAQTSFNVVSKFGYYDDLRELKEYFEISCVATTNYSNLLKEKSPEIKPLYLHGNVDEVLDPYTHEIRARDAPENDNTFTVPFLLTQSSYKPIAAIESAERFVDFYRSASESDIVAVIGFGFNDDDGHINAIIRKLSTGLVNDMKYKPRIVIFDYDHDSAKILHKLRMSELPVNAKIVPIDGARVVTDSGINWLLYLLQ